MAVETAARAGSKAVALAERVVVGRVVPVPPLPVVLQHITVAVAVGRVGVLL